MTPAVRAALFGTIVLLLAGPVQAGRQPEQRRPVLGVDPLTAGSVLESPADALAHWAQRGFRDAVLLHVSPRAGLRAIDAGKLAALQAMRDRGDFAALALANRGGKDALFDEGNFVRAAAGLGIVREVFWIVPFPFAATVEAEGPLKDRLLKDGFPPEDLATFRMKEGCFRGAAGGLPLAICPQGRLPVVGAPVLASLDAAFLLPAAWHRGVTALAEIGALFAALREARYALDEAVVAFSVRSGELPVEMRWAGEAIVESLRDPSLVLQQEPPERWSALQRLTLLRVGGPAKAGELLNVALTLLQRQPHDPALLLLAAMAVAGHGGSGASLSYAEQACRADRGYCAGLREVGLMLLERGAVDAAAPFFETAERMQPGMTYGQLDEGILLARAGRLPEATAAFDKVIAREGAFPAGFLAGAVHVAAGNRGAARRAYDEAVAALARLPHVLVARVEVAGAIAAAAAFYRDEGLLAQAEALERDPRLRPPPKDAAP